MPRTPLDAMLGTWAQALAGEQILRSQRTGTERIDQAADIARLAADVMRVESIVQRMAQTGRWKEARVLRTEFYMANLPETDKLACLARMGTSISRASYYAYLASAKAFVEGALVAGQQEAAA